MGVLACFGIGNGLLPLSTPTYTAFGILPTGHFLPSRGLLREEESAIAFPAKTQEQKSRAAKTSCGDTGFQLCTWRLLVPARCSWLVSSGTAPASQVATGNSGTEEGGHVRWQYRRAESKQPGRSLECVAENFLTQLVREPRREGTRWTCSLSTEKDWWVTPRLGAVWGSAIMKSLCA